MTDVEQTPPARGYTRTRHHAGHLSPGDLWCAVAGEHPHTAILVHRRHDRITLTDQYGATFAYPAAAVIPTAVPDALPLRDRTRPVHPVQPWNGSMTCTRPTAACRWVTRLNRAPWNQPAHRPGHRLSGE